MTTTTTTSKREAREWFARRLDELFTHYGGEPPAEAIRQASDELGAMLGYTPGEPFMLPAEPTDEERREALQTLHEIQRQAGDTSREELLAMLAEDDPSVCVDPTPYERELQSPASGSASTRTASS